jgi:hypothetical protein
MLRSTPGGVGRSASLEILKTARDLKFQIKLVWVSRDNPFLLKADAISKGIDTDNWAVSREDFDHLSALFGPFTINLFATRKKAKCFRFYTWSFEKEMLGVDAFAQVWAGECVYAAPPISLVMRTIRKAVLTGLQGVLIIPLWKSVKFWTFAFKDGIHLNGLFSSMQVVRMRATSWEFLRKDMIGGKEMQFLALRFAEKHGIEAQESVLDRGRCFKMLFGKGCKGCF